MSFGVELCIELYIHRVPHSLDLLQFTSVNGRVVPPILRYCTSSSRLDKPPHQSTKMAGDIAPAVTETSEPPPKKKSLFSKKVVAQVAEAAEGVAFFSRSSELFPQRLAEEEQRRQKKALKLERKRSSASLEKKEPSPQEEKRRRISKDRDLYSSEEDAEASWARRYCKIIFIRATVTD